MTVPISPLARQILVDLRRQANPFSVTRAPWIEDNNPILQTIQLTLDWLETHPVDPPRTPAITILP